MSLPRRDVLCMLAGVGCVACTRRPVATDKPRFQTIIILVDVSFAVGDRERLLAEAALTVLVNVPGRSRVYVIGVGVEAAEVFMGVVPEDPNFGGWLSHEAATSIRSRLRKMGDGLSKDANYEWAFQLISERAWHSREPWIVIFTDLIDGKRNGIRPISATEYLGFSGARVFVAVFNSSLSALLSERTRHHLLQAFEQSLKKAGAREMRVVDAENVLAWATAVGRVGM